MRQQPRLCLSCLKYLASYPLGHTFGVVHADSSEGFLPAHSIKAHSAAHPADALTWLFLRYNQPENLSIEVFGVETASGSLSVGEG